MLSLSGISYAQQRRANVDVQAGHSRVSVNAQRDQGNKNKQKASQDTELRASDIEGMTVTNGSGKELGTVNDLVIDTHKGRVNYAALSYGGFMGLGDKLFAVPWDAFTYHHETGSNEQVLVLKIDQETLKKAPGFNQDHWPDFAQQGRAWLAREILRQVHA